MDPAPWKKRLEVITNVAILCVCLLIAVIGVKRFLLPGSSPGLSGPLPGTKLSVANVDWSLASKTLVLALSTQCHFCSESSEFYQRLIPAAASTHTQIIAVLPQTLLEDREYFQKLGLPAVEMRQELLSAIQVNGTPTLMLVDQQGRVLRSWVGKLEAARESEVLADLK